MKNSIINNLFEFYKLVGTSNSVYTTTKQYSFVKANADSWPKVIFELNELHLNYKDLHYKIKDNQLPNLVFLLENKLIETHLIKHKFNLRSSTVGMYIDLQKKNRPEDDFASIIRVNNEKTAIEFARIASSAFNYNILPSTILTLISCNNLKIYIGYYQKQYVSCGMLLFDKNGISGLHMIGTSPKFRGLGLGKKMTNKLLYEAYKNSSKQAVLGASKAGEIVYSKLGFIADAKFKSYII